MSNTHNLDALRPSRRYGGGSRTHMHELANDPDTLYKEIRAVYANGNWHEDYDEDLFRAQVGGALDMLRDPANRLARYIPTAELAWGRNRSGQERGFIAMARVQGKDIARVLTIEPDMAAQLDDLLAAAVALGKAHSNPARGLWQLPDLVDYPRFINVVLGTTPDNPVEQPYMVDTYPPLVQAIYGRAAWDGALNRLSAQAEDYPFEQARTALDDLFGPAAAA